MSSDSRTSDDLALARAIAAAVGAVPGVASLSRGSFGEAVTYGPKETVRGVCIDRSAGQSVIRIHLVAEYRPEENLQDLARRVRRRAIRAADTGASRIDITVQDVILPAQEGL